MRIRLTVLALMAISGVMAVNAKPAFDQAIRQVLVKHFDKYKKQEYFSGIALSVAVPDDEIHNYYIGNISHEANSQPITPDTLFEIGSITKSFTAALMLQLEKEKRLNLKDKTSKYLPDYAKWGHASLESLINMTSCLPNYSDAPVLNTVFSEEPAHVFTNEDLLDFVYPKGTFAPPLKTGYMYSNTGYILADMIIAKLTKRTYKTELEERLFAPAKLSNTFYPVPVMNADIRARMAHGYGFNQYTNPELVGRDLYNVSLSWAAAAGGIVATTEDVVKWVRALFVENTILDNQQKEKMMAAVSTQTGKPLVKVSATDSKSFGLGIAGLYNSAYPLESMWMYEGQTTGFRVLYIYVPCNQVIVAAAFNSATNGENDHAHVLLQEAYALLIKQRPALRCHA